MQKAWWGIEKPCCLSSYYVHQGNFSLMYGFLTSVQSDDDTLTVIYALHKLKFLFPGKIKALVALQQQNVIKTIIYDGVRSSQK